MKAPRVLLGMSGGVDSSMSAWYLQQQGYEVVGITLNTLSSISSPASLHFIQEAESLAQKLNFEHHVVDVYNDFKKEVIDYFVDEYLIGRTPNPCIRCNETIKWKLLFEESERLNCDKIATGHYVNICKKESFFYIKKAKDPAKDQSYFLWNLSQSTLKKCLFPLGNLLKSEVKRKAQELGFKQMANKKESMGICFLQGKYYRDFILSLKPSLSGDLAAGEILNSTGETIGTHEGFPFYTIGQKRGLNLTKNQGECVASINAINNVLTTAPKQKLFSNKLKLINFLTCHPDLLKQKQRVDIRIRGLDAVPPTPANIELINNELMINFDTPVWALSPGQSIVFYQNDLVVGGGIVDDFNFIE